MPEGPSNPNMPKPSTPPVPSPPLPTGIKPVAPTPAVPSPPVPKINPPREATPAHFQLTPDENAVPAAPSTPPAPANAPAPKTAPTQPAASNPKATNPKATNPKATNPKATNANPGSQNPAAPAAPRTPAMPRTPQTPSMPQTPPMPRTPSMPRSAAAPNFSPNASTPSSANTSHPASTATKHQTEEYHSLNMGAEIRNWLDKADGIITGIFRVASFGASLALAFILYSIFITKIGAPVALPAAQAGNLKLAATLLHWSVVFLAFTGILLALDMKGLGIALVAGGLAIHFGAPWALFGHAGKTNAIIMLVGTLKGTGMWLVYLGILRSAFDLMQWIVELPDRKKQRADVGVGRKAEAAQQRVARDANMFSPCWKLPFCREVIRKQCPAFLAKKTCWRFGRGCYCDEEMISRIIKGESLEVIKAPTRLSKAGKAPCGRCHIYLEHQGYKYKILSPLAIPITGIIMYFFWPFWTKSFLAFSNAPFWNSISFDTKKITPGAVSTTEVATTQLADSQVAQVATILIGVLIGFFVLTYVCKFIEWFVYKLKL